MGVIQTEAGPFEIKGDEPSPTELQAIAGLIQSQRQQKPAPDTSQPPPGWTNDEEINQWSGKKQWQYPDAPSTGRIELPGVNPFGKKDIEGNDALPIMSKLALQYGTLSTDNPKARQEIYVKHLPGATAAEDKFGNPMIEYKGQKYYTSAPGVDAMDLGRATAGVVGALPAAMLAPVSVPGMVVAGGLLGAGQSVAEDLVTQAAGGKSQDIDLTKAGVSGGVGALAGPLLKSVVPIARRLYGAVAGELFDAAGQPTARGAVILREAGITPEQINSMTPEVRQEITRSVNSNFGSSDAAFAGQNRALGREFNVPQTTGEITGDTAQIAKEKTLRGGSRGEEPKAIMDEFGANRQEGNLTQAQQAIRNRTGVPARTPIEAGEAFNAEFGRTNRAAQNNVTAAYDRAFNPEELARRGIAPEVQIESIQGLPNAIEDHFVNSTRSGGALIPTRANTPTTMEAIDRLREFSQNGSIPSAFPKATDAAAAARAAGGDAVPTAVGWQQIDLMRKQLSRLRSGIPQTPDRATDRDALNTVIRAFDEHLSQGNPLLRDAMNAASERFGTFLPGRNQTDLTKSVLKVLNKPEGAQEGAEVFNTLFSTKLAKGEALGAVDHLLTIHPPGSPGANTMAEQGLQKIFVNAKDGSTKTPRQIVTAIDQALGDRQGDVYRRLLTNDQLNELIRFRTLNENIANAITNLNPSGSGHLAVGEARRAASRLLGGGGAVAIARIMGMNAVGQAVLGAGGAAASKATGQAVSNAAARSAIAPAANAGGVTAGQIAGPGGILAAPAAEGPVDRIWRGLMGP